MSGPVIAWTGARIFDGADSRQPVALLVEGGTIAGVVAEVQIPDGSVKRDLGGGILAPGYVDLQVNGGGGIQFNDDPSVAALRRIAEAHGRLGATTILPTLITDTPAATKAAVNAVARAVAEGVPGIAGLHLEGPHLSRARKGAHDPALIRPMTNEDLKLLRNAAARLPVLMVTVAPESASPDQIRALADAGAVVSLGHSDATYARCRESAGHGATCVTHLFNAMSQFGSREPGLVGAALDCGSLHAGLIADGIHVHPATMAAALRAKRPPGRVFLVSDAMAPAGSDIRSFALNGRRIERRDGRLTLADGTLAGADLDLTTAVNVVHRQSGIPLDQALAMATSVPAAVAGLQDRCGTLAPGYPADFVWLNDEGMLAGVWRRGVRLVG